MSYNQKFSKFINSAERELKRFRILNQIEEHAKIPRVYVATGLLCALGLVIYLTLSLEFLVNVFAVAYPIYATYLAIETGDTKCNKQIMAYWIIYGLINVFESSPWELSKLIPAYQTLKILLFSFLFMPKYNGSVIVYNKFLKTTLGKGIPCIEKAVSNFKKTLRDASDGGGSFSSADQSHKNSKNSKGSKGSSDHATGSNS